MSYKSEFYANTAKTLIKNLEKRQMTGYYCETAHDAIELIKELIPEDSRVTWGGSETLVETGIMDMLKKSNYSLIDRKSAKTPEESRRLYGEIVTADYFLMSTNAITTDGELINVDGIGNRAACLIHGPKHVLVVAGMNKLVANIEDGIRRIHTMAAPPNSIRVGAKTPCSVTGVCADCHSPSSICCQTVVTRHSFTPGRIKVILIGEDYGF